MATISLNKRDSCDEVRTHELTLENVNKNIELPLFGHICLRLAVQSDHQIRESVAGFVKFTENIKSSPPSPSSSSSSDDDNFYWCSLRNFKLNLWKVDKASLGELAYVKHTIKKKAASLVVPISSNTKISLSSDTLLVVNGHHSYSIQCTSSSSSGTTTNNEWYNHLVECKQCFIAWEPISEYQMELASVSRGSSLLRSRVPGTLYEETHIQSNSAVHS